MKKPGSRFEEPGFQVGKESMPLIMPQAAGARNHDFMKSTSVNDGAVVFQRRFKYINFTVLLTFLLEPVKPKR
jgi:hypothetical protein